MSPSRFAAPGGRWPRDTLGHQRFGVVGDMRARIGRQRIGQQGAAAARDEAGATRCTGQRKKKIASDVGLEIDREIVIRRRHARARAHQARQESPRPFARHPRHVERFDGVTPGISSRERNVPTADDEIDFGVRRQVLTPQWHRAPSADRRRARAAAAGFAVDAGWSARAAAATGQPDGTDPASARPTSIAPPIGNLKMLEH